MIEKKVVLISGGSRGLGKALIEELLKQGYLVAAFSRRSSEFIEKIQKAPEWNGQFIWEEVDALDSKAVKELAKKLYKQYGKIDVLINNAGCSIEGILPLMQEDAVSKIIDLNVNATILLTRYVSKIMLKNGSGKIINISSIVGTRGFKGDSVYSASKAAIDGFTRSLARELGGKGIRVNSVAPGFMNTEMTANMSEEKKKQIIRRTPLGRLGSTEDMVGIVKFLISEESDFITGQTFVVDGGLTC